MVQRNAVFKFIVDIKDFLQKGRIVVGTLDRIEQRSGGAAAGLDRVGQASRRSADQAAAAAVNFQTMTQGMLNLTTAGVQTFTSFSNLDRAGNRLAASRVGLARATDLLSAKELRLVQLREKGGDQRKAAQLEQEIATARADLAVKTDKLKIEEGALLDIQLLFVTNIANVMISSIQTIKTLKDLQIAATIKEVIHNKLLNITLAQQNAQRLQSMPIMKGTIAATNAQAVANRSLLLTLGPIGLAIGGITLAITAYTENWLGFGDAVREVLPFLKDKKETLREVESELEHTGEGWKTLTGTVRAETGKQIEIVRFWENKMVESMVTVNRATANSLRQTDFSSGGKTPQQPFLRFADPKAVKLTGLLMSGKIDFSNVKLIKTLPVNQGVDASQFSRFTVTDQIKVRQREGAMVTKLLNRDSETLTSSLSNTAKELLLSQIAPSDTSVALANLRASQEPLITILDHKRGEISKVIRRRDFIEQKIAELPEVISDINTARNAAALREELNRILISEQKLREEIDLLSGNRSAAIDTNIFQQVSTGILSTTKEQKLSKVQTLKIRGEALLEKARSGAFPATAAQLSQQGFTLLRMAANLSKEVALQDLMEQVEEANKRAEPTPFNTFRATVPNGFIFSSGFDRLPRGATSVTGPGIGGQADIAIATFLARGGGQAVSPGRLSIHPIHIKERAIHDLNLNKLKTGGKRVVDEFGVPLFGLDDPRAVQGGFANLRQFRIHERRRVRQEFFRDAAISGLLGGAVVGSRKQLFLTKQREVDLLQRMGLDRFLSRGRFIFNRGHKKFIPDINLEFNLELAEQAQRFESLIPTFDPDHFNVLADFQSALGFLETRRNKFKDVLSLSFKQQALIEQDAMRGVNELNDRVRFAERMEAISTGTSAI